MRFRYVVIQQHQALTTFLDQSNIHIKNSKKEKLVPYANLTGQKFDIIIGWPIQKQRFWISGLTKR